MARSSGESGATSMTWPFGRRCGAPSHMNTVSAATMRGLIPMSVAHADVVDAGLVAAMAEGDDAGQVPGPAVGRGERTAGNDVHDRPVPGERRPRRAVGVRIPRHRDVSEDTLR